jgi:hypothetical protein
MRTLHTIDATNPVTASGRSRKTADALRRPNRRAPSDGRLADAPLSPATGPHSPVRANMAAGTIDTRRPVGLAVGLPHAAAPPDAISGDHSHEKGYGGQRSPSVFQVGLVE